MNTYVDRASILYDWRERRNFREQAPTHATLFGGECTLQRIFVFHALVREQTLRYSLCTYVPTYTHIRFFSKIFSAPFRRRSIGARIELHRKRIGRSAQQYQSISHPNAERFVGFFVTSGRFVNPFESNQGGLFGFGSIK